jgi:phage-related protein (TIGR01555 family)
LLQLAQQLSGSLQIPLTILLGQSPAGLNATGDSDLENFYSGVEREQNTKLRTAIAKLIEISWRSLHGAPPPDGTTFRFNPLWQLSDTEKAAIAQQTTTTVISAYEAGIVDKPTALRELRQASRETGRWTNITDQAISDAEAGPPPIPELPEPSQVPAEAPKEPVAEEMAPDA